MKEYSEIKKDLEQHFHGNDAAYVTHYMQNPEAYSDNEIQSIVSEPAVSYSRSLTLPVFFDVPFPPPSNPDFTFIDLFAGIGGFRIAMQHHGGKCVFSSEFNLNAQRVYEANYGEFPYGDITQIDEKTIPWHDVLCAGFPCQPFSISGKMKGFEDTRGTLIYDVFRIINAKKPKVVFLENVKHLVYHDNGKTLSTIIEGLASLGYKSSHKVLNASDFGVAQNRERIIIIAHREKVFDFSKLNRQPHIAIKDIVDGPDTEFEYLQEPYTLLDKFTTQPSGLIFVGYRNKKIRKAGVRPGTEHLSRVHKQPNRIYSIEGVHPALPSQETSGRFWIYDGNTVRKLTINECYRIMGFPDSFIKATSLGDQYRQVGNSVCIPMIEEITKQIKAQLL
ncbi:MAG: DNA cytosine methyltransferase [Muribaculaceae bacterium]|nr:DNA cytosine methyltransferase [Muribaculaceae bacterium]